MNQSSVSLRLCSLRFLCGVVAAMATCWMAERAAAAGTIDVLSAGAPSPQAAGVTFPVTVRMQSTGISENVCATVFSGSSGGMVSVSAPSRKCAGTVGAGQIATLSWNATFTFFPGTTIGEVSLTAIAEWTGGSTFFSGQSITMIQAAAPAQLAVFAVTPSVGSVFSGVPFTVDVPIRNSATAGSNGANITAVTLQESNGGPQPACGTPTPDGTGVLAPQAIRTFRFTCQASIPGNYRLAGSVTGTDATTGQVLASGVLLSPPIIVNSPAAGLQVTSVVATPAAVAGGEVIAIDVFVRNTALVGGHDATAVAVALVSNAPSVGNASAAACTQTSPADGSPLGPQAERRFSFGCVATGHGTFTFRGDASGVDGGSPLTANGPSAAVAVSDGVSPTVAIAPSPVPWSALDLNFELTATDNAQGSGVASVTVQIDGGPLSPTSGATVSVSLTAEAQHTITFFATDHAGNNSPTTAVTAGIDRSAPTITASQAPAAVDGWNNAAVTVSFACNDALSGVQSCSGPVALTTETAGTAVPGSAVDNAGNSAGTSWGPVRIDLTAPVVSGALVESANAAGWYAGPVTARFTCTDALSGIATCPGDVVVVTQGGGQTASGTAFDVAGNSASASVPGINIDLGAPTISGARAPAANGNGWNNGAVSVTFTCADGLSGVASCAQAQTLSGEGTNQQAQGTATDVAGQTATTTVGGINIDLTPPSIGASSSPVANFLGWNNTPVAVHFDCADALSGVGTCAPDVAFATEGLFTAAGAAADRAGNVAQGAMLAIKIDLGAPVVMVPGQIVAEATSAAGAAVAFAVTAADALSGYLPGSLGCMAGGGPVLPGATFPLGTTVVSCGAMDLAGNVGMGTFTVTVSDTTAPVLAAMSDLTAEATSAAGVAVTFASPAATDLVSGPLSATCVPASGAIFPVGATVVTCSAKDAAPNVAQTSFTVTVTRTTLPPVIGKVPGTNAQNQLIAFASTIQGAVVNYTRPTATDAAGRRLAVTCTPPPGTRFAAGQNVVTCSAADSSGNTASATFTVWVKFQVAVDRSGNPLLQPINSDGSSLFRINAVVPVRFKLTGPSAAIKNAVVYLKVVKVSNTPQGTRLENVCIALPDSGDKFRYESGNKHYEFNFTTRGLTAGTYELRIELTDGKGQRRSDGVVHTGKISLKR